MKSYAVIGANWGDEGKGLITDYLCRQVENPLVIRYNGGAQAGHTVVTPEGNKHIFSHFGSGTFTGAPTFLSKYFIVNPILFRKEYNSIEENITKNPIVVVSPDCIITTPFDMMINQAIEEKRNKNRHGSCGYGIFETIHRNKVPGFHFTIRDLNIWGHQKFHQYLTDIIKFWLPKRMEELEIKEINPAAFYPETIESFINCCEYFLERVVLCDEISISNMGFDKHTLIF